MRCLIFDIWGATAHFRRFDTTTSPLSWPFPPRPTVFGILGAIAGLGKRSYLERFQDPGVRVAVGIVSPGRTVRVPFNEPDTKKRMDGFIAARTQIGRELLFDPRFRLFVTLPDVVLLDEIASRVRNHRAEYTVSLGQAWNLADFRLVALADCAVRPLAPAGEAIATVVPAAAVRPDVPTSLLLRRVPRHMTPDRVVREYADVHAAAPGTILPWQVRPNADVNVEVLDCSEFGVAVPL